MGEGNFFFLALLVTKVESDKMGSCYFPFKPLVSNPSEAYGHGSQLVSVSASSGGFLVDPLSSVAAGSGLC